MKNFVLILLVLIATQSIFAFSLGENEPKPAQFKIYLKPSLSILLKDSNVNDPSESYYEEDYDIWWRRFSGVGHYRCSGLYDVYQRTR